MRRPATLSALAGGLGAAAAALALLAPATSAAPAYGLMNCTGFLNHQTPTPDDPNLTGYEFHCTQNVASYTLVINRQRNDFSTMDDLSPTADVYDPSNTIISTTNTVGCEGTTPGNGINCFSQGGPAPSSIPTTAWVHGTFDTFDPFCANVPQGSKPGTKAEPAAIVQLVVSDAYGNEFGPFRLNMTPRCPAAPKTKPFTTTTGPKKPKTRTHSGRKRTVSTTP